MKPNGGHVTIHIFKSICLNQNCDISIQNTQNVCFQEFDYAGIGLDNGLVLFMQPMIIICPKDNACSLYLFCAGTVF